MTDKRGTIISRTGIHPTEIDSTQWNRRQTISTVLRYRTRVRPLYLANHNINSRRHIYLTVEIECSVFWMPLTFAAKNKNEVDCTAQLLMGY